MDKTQERFLKKTQDLLRYCITCQPYDGGSYIWILGEKTTVEEIFDDINCPENIRDEIAKHLSCGSCSAEIYSRYDIVGTESRYESEMDSFVEKAMKKHGRELLDFNEFLGKYPSLAQGHPLGRKLFKEISQKKTPSFSIENEKWIRARQVSDSKLFDIEDMKAPPIGKSSEGRYNHGGQSVLYMAQYKETAYLEAIGEEKASLIWKQEFKLKNIDNILDLKYEWTSLRMTYSSILIALLCSQVLENEVNNRESKWKPEYFITQYIGDCARYAGYTGIRYNSTKDIGYNLVLFEPKRLLDEGKVVPIEEPEIVQFKPKLIADYPF